MTSHAASAQLVVRGLSKSYGSKLVLDNVDLDVEGGEIHALLGPNGSGKSTLIGCLTGAVEPGAGSISVLGAPLTDITPRKATAAGLAVIYQHFSLVNTLSVSDNIFLGSEIRRRGEVDRDAQRARSTELLAPFGREIHPDTILENLRVGDRQLVEIAKALRHRPSVLVLDEPTAALGDSEATALGGYLLQLRASGLAILYVTHILSEVFVIADRATILRDGRVVLADRVASLNPARVIAAISPSTGAASTAVGAASSSGGEPLLKLEDVVVDGIGPVSLSVAPGEIVAIFGLLGSGRTELVEGVYGARPLEAGKMWLKGAEHRPGSPREALKRGVALVAGDRRRQSIFDKLSAGDNVLLPHFTQLAHRGARHRTAESTTFQRAAERLRLSPADPTPLAWSFSGGNQQKLAVGRWLASDQSINLLMLDEPTQGIDVGARADLYAIVRAVAHDEGKAVLFTSSDPEETMSLADRIAVLRRGMIVAQLDRRACTGQQILAIAHGTEPVGAPQESSLPQGSVEWQ